MAVPVLEPTADAVSVLAQVHAALGSIPSSDYAVLGSGAQREAASSLARMKARVTAHEPAAVAATVEPRVRDACESQLVDHAQRLDLPTFKRRADPVVGSFLVEPDDTTGLDAAENQIVADREKRAWGKAEGELCPESVGAVPSARVRRIEARRWRARGRA